MFIFESIFPKVGAKNLCTTLSFFFFYSGIFRETTGDESHCTENCANVLLLKEKDLSGKTLKCDICDLWGILWVFWVS